MKIELENAVVYAGSNLDVLPTLPDNSVDSIVTDPPYELGFMGKSWDNSGIAYSVELWTECMRVLKPGGHLLAFGGSRTWHRLAVAIEDAGFEMRDSIAWLYGSGFPKSMDISKQIDKQRKDVTAIAEVAEKMRILLSASGKSKSELDVIFGTKNVAQYWFSPHHKAEIVPAERWPIVREWLGAGDELDAEVLRLNGRKGQPGEAWEQRKVIGSKTAGMGSGKSFGMLQAEGVNSQAEKEIDITAPATDEAKQWQGWGTALKPAFEPVVVARKPLAEKTVAANVLKFGTGGLNIEGSRIGSEGGRTIHTKSNGDSRDRWEGNTATGDVTEYGGRWPANIILDPYTAELLDEQSGISKSPKAYKSEGYKDSSMFGVGGVNHDKEFGDSGGASRFFYVAKASKKDRNEGLDHLEVKRPDDRTETGMGSFAEKGVQPGRNFHPTVKPTALMEYLIKLVTPPNGTVLDPFTGSGSTGKAALLAGFKFVGIELTEEYLPIIEGRLKWATEQASKTEEEKNEVLF